MLAIYLPRQRLVMNIVVGRLDKNIIFVFPRFWEDGRGLLYVEPIGVRAVGHGAKGKEEQSEDDGGISTDRSLNAKREVGAKGGQIHATSWVLIF